MRLIALDTETTGLRSKDGDRVIELAMTEISRSSEPRTYHAFFNPQGREIAPDAFAVHGISAEFLADKPTFADCFEEIIEFIGGATLVIHNAPFDLEFLRDEALEAGSVWPEVPVIDTLKLASRERPGKHNSLDALCNWLGIDLSQRTKHSALIDTALLAEVYLRWKGQSALDLTSAAPVQETASAEPARPMNPARIAFTMPDAMPASAWDKVFSGHNL